MKKKIRKEILALRKAVPKDVLEEKSKLIAEKVTSHPNYQQADTILAYIDAKGEVQTKPIIEDAWSKGKKVAVPKVHGDIMKFYLISSYEELEPGNFGILEPVENCEVIINILENTVVLMPGVAFDMKGNRIGYGKGYYDKYFSKYPETYKIALAFSMQIVPEIPADEFDIKANCVITEKNEMEEK